ncbi:MAG TPA: hypothetical protein VFB98_06205 [Candidatus Deferrimicrobium sp.]|nr:hypothetical protein [Candidatus Deferrimicrobium sp.]
MLIQVAINNIESIEQGEEILKKWHYHLDEDQSHVVVERDVDGVTVRISGFHPWADEMGEDGEECSCGGDDDNCGCKGGHCKDDHEHAEGECCKDGHEHTEGGSCCQVGDDAADVKDKDDESDDEGEESEVIYLGQALFMPAEDQAHVLANELMDDDYIGTVSVSMAGVELTDTDAFRALPADTKSAVIAAIEELGDAEAYFSMYEIMGLKA